MKKHTNKSRRPSLESRFRAAQASMRALRVTTETKELQKDIMWLMDSIEGRGFNFFPHHYDVHTDIDKFEVMVRQLKDHPSTKAKR